MERLLDFLVEVVINYAPYIGIAIMIGVNKAVGKLEEKDLPFTVKNILKYSIVYAIIAPLKVGFDIKSQMLFHGQKTDRLKKEKEEKDKESKKDT